MKNPFQKEDNDGIWASGFAVGLIAAGTIAWIFYLKYAADRKALADQAEYAHMHANDYLKPKPSRKAKTDVRDLEALAHSHHEA